MSGGRLWHLSQHTVASLWRRWMTVVFLSSELSWCEMTSQIRATLRDTTMAASQSRLCLFIVWFPPPLLLPLCHFEPILCPVSPIPLTKSLYLPLHLPRVSSCTLLNVPVFISLSCSIPISSTIIYSLCYAIPSSCLRLSILSAVWGYFLLCCCCFFLSRSLDLVPPLTHTHSHCWTLTHFMCVPAGL